MGASLALALRAARPDLLVLGEDPDAATMRKATERGVAEAGDLSAAEIVVLAAPIPALPELLARFEGHPGVVTDLASTKVRVMGWAAASGVDLVGGHPMCGRERTGIDAADPDLFRGAPWVLTRDEPVLTDLVRAVGARPLFMVAERHDRLVADVSHAAFLVSTAYVLALSGSPDWPAMQPLAGTGFRDMSRLAAGDPQLYSAIVSTNREAIAEALGRVEGSLNRIRRHLEASDSRLVELFEEAKRMRDRWAEVSGAGQD